MMGASRSTSPSCISDDHDHVDTLSDSDNDTHIESESDVECDTSSSQSETQCLAQRIHDHGYAIQQMLGESLFGAVYAAKARNHDSALVALKISSLQLARKQISSKGIPVIEDVFRETQVMLRLQANEKGHPNVLKLYDDWVAGDAYVCVLEYASQGDLFDYIAARPASEKLARTCFKQLLAGLQHVHTSGFAHMDMSLENVLVSQDGLLKICDFGSAQAATRTTQLKFPGAACKPGKRRYQCPELLAGSAFSAHSADVFAMGVMLFVMLTKNNPFEEATVNDVRYNLVSSGRLGKLLQASGLQSLVSDDAQDLLQLMLNPEKRRISLQQVMQHKWLSQ